MITWSGHSLTLTHVTRPATGRGHNDCTCINARRVRPGRKGSAGPPRAYWPSSPVERVDVHHTAGGRTRPLYGYVKKTVGLTGSPRPDESETRCLAVLAWIMLAVAIAGKTVSCSLFCLVSL